MRIDAFSWELKTFPNFNYGIKLCYLIQGVNLREFKLKYEVRSARKEGCS